MLCATLGILGIYFIFSSCTWKQFLSVSHLKSNFDLENGCLVQLQESNLFSFSSHIRKVILVGITFEKFYLGVR